MEDLVTSPVTLPSVQAPAEPLPTPDDQLNSHGNYKAVRNAIYDRALRAAQAIAPVSNKTHTLALKDLAYEGPEDYTRAEHKKAVLEGTSLTRRLRGTWQFSDNAGNVLGERRTTVANVPHYTDHGTFVLGGNEHSLGTQQRLRPGAYSRIKDNGVIENHMNVRTGTGMSHRIELEPETGVFKVNIAQADIPLMPVLRAMGVTDEELDKHWGRELVTANSKHDNPAALHRLYAKLSKKPIANASDADKQKELLSLLGKMEFDPEVNKRTLGVAHKNMNKDVLLAATNKMLRISRGEAEPDDRDHLANQWFMGPEDLIAERFTRSNAHMQNLLWKVATKGDMEQISPSYFDPHVHGAITDSGVGTMPEGVNLAELLDLSTRVTRMGMGALTSVDSIPDEARAVSPSQMNYVDLLRTSESLSVGVDLRMASNARKDPNSPTIKSKFIDPRTGKPVYMAPQDVTGKVVAFPNEMHLQKPLIWAMVNDKPRLVPKDKVDLVIPHMEETFSPINNLVPMKSGIKGQRAAMASRFFTQALPLVNREAPLVQGAMPGTNGERSYDEEYGVHLGAVRARDVGGTVQKVTPDEITVKYDDGKVESHQLYNNFLMPRKTFSTSEAKVGAGMRVEPKQLLATSNMTDHEGTAAIGLNARIVVHPHEGTSFEDAYSISESFAKRLRSMHMYRHDLETSDQHRTGRNNFANIFPATYSREKLANIDEDGLIKPGTKVKHGDPLILAALERPSTAKTVYSSHKGRFANASVLWDHHDDGVVTDVAKTKKGYVVTVKSENDAQIGDKLTNLYANKGVISRIWKDHEMPHGPDGKPFDAIYNPLGMISRSNPSSITAALLGKIAEKTGKKYKVEDFAHIDDLAEFALKEAEKYGVPVYEDMHDPVTGKTVPKVFNGNMYFLKLAHTGEAKAHGRGLGSYSSLGEPARTGGPESARRFAMQDVYALAAHGAYDVMRDVKLVRGQKNSQFWSDFMGGHMPTTPEVPMVYKNMVNSMRAGGINVVRNGTQTRLMAMSDKDVDELAGDRELLNTETVDWKDGAKPIKGGLFDDSLFGGHGNSRWAKISLPEPMVNPAFEDPVRHLLGLTKDGLRQAIAGQLPINGLYGPDAVRKALSAIDVTSALTHAREDVKTGRGEQREKAIRKLGYLKALEGTGKTPADYMMTKVPVIPTAFRPVNQMENGSTLVHDANLLYKELFDAKEGLKSMKGRVDDLSDERLGTYDALKAVVGLGDPTNPKNQERGLKGFLANVLGDGAKYSCFDEETEILTKTGWKRFAELHVGETVATLNPTTAAFEWQDTEQVQHYAYEGEMLHLRTPNGVDMLVTPNHRNWARACKESTTGKKRAAADMTAGWAFELASKTLIDNRRKWFRTSADSWAGVISGIPSFWKGTPLEWASFVGWWVAEGDVGGYLNRRVSIMQTSKQKDYCDELEHLFSLMGTHVSKGTTIRTTPKSKQPSPTRYWHMTLAPAAAWLLEHCGKYSQGKKLSRTILDWPTELLEAFLLAYLRGDGGKRKIAKRANANGTHKNSSQLNAAHMSCNTASEVLCGNLQEIMCKVSLTGRSIVIKPANPRHLVQWKVGISGSRFVVTSGQSCRSKTASHVKEMVPYSGDVHCCSVPNGIVLVRRRGRPFFSGNSFHQKLMGTNIDLIGAGVVIPDPELNMDEVGLPEGRAWSVFTPFVVRRLVQRGVPRVKALQEVEGRSKMARDALLEEMKHRPVEVNRAPVLHKFGRIALFPKLVSGDTVRTSPLIVKGLGQDHDGDVDNYTVPVTEAARLQAIERMLPSKNLFSPGAFGKPMYEPLREHRAGIIRASTHKKTDARPQVFATGRDLHAAYAAGKVDPDQPVRVINPDV